MEINRGRKWQLKSILSLFKKEKKKKLDLLFTCENEEIVMHV